MSNLKHWSDVVTIVSGKNQKNVADENGEYPIYGSGGIMGYASDYLCEAGTTIVGRKGTINKPIFVNRRFWNVDTAFGITPGEELNPKYLYYFCQYFNFAALDKSTTIPSLAKRDLLAIEMPVPSLEEQQCIVARIEELFSQLDDAEATLQKTKAQLTLYSQAVLQSVFSTADGCKEYAIEEICERIVDCPHSTPKWVSHGKLCLRTTNFRRGYLDLSEPNYVSEETFERRNARLVPMPGDVLYSREGAILGIACIIPEDTYVCLGQRMMLLRPGKKVINKFLMYYLNSPAVTSLIVSKIGGSASPHVNVGDIKKIRIPIPEIEQQEKLVTQIESRLSLCKEIEYTVSIILLKLTSCKQSILNTEFKGDD